MYYFAFLLYNIVIKKIKLIYKRLSVFETTYRPRTNEWNWPKLNIIDLKTWISHIFTILLKFWKIKNSFGLKWYRINKNFLIIKIHNITHKCYLYFTLFLLVRILNIFRKIAWSISSPKINTYLFQNIGERRKQINTHYND